MKKLDEKLDDGNYRRFEATLGGDGVGVLWPAVLKNGLEDDDEEGGMEIDVEKFLNAEGMAGVERLVGADSGGRGDGWKHWSVESH